jgi:2-hydroxychromene-2-carboxylate isomerase
MGMAQRRIRVYSDYKSPYAYLAKDLVYELERETGVTLDWLPYTLDIPAYLGSAKVDSDGNVVEASRNAHQWRRVKYSYMDCRREVNRRGLTLRGPRKIFDSSLANAGMLYAKRHGTFRAYHDRVFDRFWKRELDIESAAALATVLAECGADIDGFVSFIENEGRANWSRSCARQKMPVYSVASFLFDDGDLYWGREHLPRIRELLTSA